MISNFSHVFVRLAWSIVGTLGVVLVTVQSAAGQITVTGALIVERTAAPGETYKGAITLRNTTDAIQTARLSLADYRFDAAGSNSFDSPGAHARTNTRWITLSQESVTLPPQGTQVVGYTVTVPPAPVESTYVLGVSTVPSASVGSYWSVVLIEGEDRSTAPASSSEFTVSPKIRFAVQLVTHVGQTGECQLGFGSPRVQAGTMVVDVVGQGTRACRPSLKLEVYDSAGALRHTAALRGTYLYPDTSTRQTFELAPLTPGTYSFLVLADVGAETLQGARFQVHVK